MLFDVLSTNLFASYVVIYHQYDMRLLRTHIGNFKELLAQITVNKATDWNQSLGSAAFDGLTMGNLIILPLKAHPHFRYTCLRFTNPNNIANVSITRLAKKLLLNYMTQLHLDSKNSINFAYPHKKPEYSQTHLQIKCLFFSLSFSSDDSVILVQGCIYTYRKLLQLIL